MSHKKLFAEAFDFDKHEIIMNESVENGIVKARYVEGPFLGYGSKNRNGRIYAHDTLLREANRFQELINTRQSLGELNHPETLQVNPKEACVLITELKDDPSNSWFYGKAKVLTHTPNGQLLGGLLTDGVRMGMSSRGAGTLMENGVNVDDDFELVTIDCVYMPSYQNAYIDESMCENVNRVREWVLNESTGLYVERFVPKADAFNKKVEKAKTKSDVVKAFEQLFMTF